MHGNTMEKLAHTIEPEVCVCEKEGCWGPLRSKEETLVTGVVLGLSAGETIINSIGSHIVLINLLHV